MSQPNLQNLPVRTRIGRQVRAAFLAFKEALVKPTHRIYYAHAMGLYGSDYELAQRQAIRMAFGECLCPNGPEHQGGWQDLGMGYFDVLLEDIDGVAFEPYSDGMVGTGVAYEVNATLAAGKPVWRIVPGTVHDEVSFVPWIETIPPERIVSKDETRERNRALAERLGTLGKRLWSSVA